MKSGCATVTADLRWIMMDDTGEVLPVTEWLDAEGAHTDEADDVVTVVGGPDREDMAVRVDLFAETATLQ